ncbi:hypothetical protein P9112_003946 [Eukaryota sp. TZLM1-RC]
MSHPLYTIQCRYHCPRNSSFDRYILEILPDNNIQLKPAIESTSALLNTCHHFKLQNAQIEVLSFSSSSLFGLHITTTDTQVHLEFDNEELRRRLLDKLLSHIPSLHISPSSDKVIPCLTQSRKVNIFDRFGLCFYQTLSTDWSPCRLLLNEKSLYVLSNDSDDDVIYHVRLKKVFCFLDAPHLFPKLNRSIIGSTSEISDIIILSTNSFLDFPLNTCNYFCLGFCNFTFALSWIKDISRNIYLLTGRNLEIPFWMHFLTEFIWKKGEGITGLIFKKRFFILHKAILLYFNDPNDTHPLGSIPLELSVNLPLSVGDFDLKLECKRSNSLESTRTWHLRFQSTKVRDLWSNVLTKVIKGHWKVSTLSLERKDRVSSVESLYDPDDVPDDVSSMKSTVMLNFKPMSGYLDKLGQINRTFKRRFCKLFPGELLYFEDDSPLSFPLGIISLLGCEVDFGSKYLDSEDRNVFCVKSPSRLWVFRSDDFTGTRDWIDAIQLAINCSRTSVPSSSGSEKFKRLKHSKSKPLIESPLSNI